VHHKRANYDVYIGNPSKWGTPYRIGVDGNRKECIQKYREWLTTTPEGQKILEEAKLELKGKVLACWCAPLPCHGHVLAELVNRPVNPTPVGSTPKINYHSLENAVADLVTNESILDQANDSEKELTDKTYEDDEEHEVEDSGEEDNNEEQEEGEFKRKSKRYSTWRENIYANINFKVGTHSVLPHSQILPVISVTFPDGGQ